MERSDIWETTDYPLHDRELAAHRIAERPKDFYGVRSIDDLVLRKRDFEKAAEICKTESEIVHLGSRVLTPEGVGFGLIYCLLTPQQNWKGQISGFINLTASQKPVNQMDSHEIQTILDSSGVTFGAQKARYIQAALSNLHQRDYPAVIGDGVGHGRDIESTLRQIVIDDFKGIGLKTASLLLRMCGAHDLIPIDAWMIEMLYFHGYPCEAPRRKALVKKWRSDEMVLKTRKSGMRENAYVEAETFTVDLAKKYGVTPILLQAAYYARGSGYQAT